MKWRSMGIVAMAAALAWGFWENQGIVTLCAGLAMFLFGMQMLEESLRQLASGKLEQWMARSTSTPFKGLLFGVAGTFVLQSSTLVSLLTIAFISAGLLQLAGGISIILGANLGATSGIWLLALAGQNFSLSSFAWPMVVFGVLAGFTGPKGKSAGRVLLGIAFIFLGIDQLKGGFGAFGGDVDFSTITQRGMMGALLFTGIGLAATVVLQSSHATLILTLTALSGGHLSLDQALAVAIGANVGSSVSTAFVGMLGGNRSGQHLALAHVIFNVTTATLAFILLVPLTWFVLKLSQLLGFGGNALLELALFHTLFNLSGVILFWSLQGALGRKLEQWLPVHQEPEILTESSQTNATQNPRERARYLSAQALESVDAATAALARELQHLGRCCVEVIGRSLLLPVERLRSDDPQAYALSPDREQPKEEAEALYQHYVKGVYADMLNFIGKLELPLDAEHKHFWMRCQMSATYLVNAVKDAKHLQKNLDEHLRAPDSTVRDAYLVLWRHLLVQLHALYQTMNHSSKEVIQGLQELEQEAEQFQISYRQRLFAMVKRGELEGLSVGSLMNDLGYADRLVENLRMAMMMEDEPNSLRRLRRRAFDEIRVTALPSES